MRRGGDVDARAGAVAALRRAAAALRRSAALAAVLLLGAGVALGSGACDDFVLEIRVGVDAEPSTLTIRIGGRSEVTARVSTTNVDEDDVALTWRSADPGIAAVDPTGERTAVVTGRAAGSTVVTVTAAAPDAAAPADTVEVTVTD